MLTGLSTEPPCPEPASSLRCSLSFWLVAGCGGGEEDASEEPEGTRTDGVSEVTRDDDDQPDTTVRDSAEQTDQPDADAEPEPLLVRLGDRFPVCADVQAKWDAFDGSQAALQTAEAAYQNAVSAHAAATDELDRAEARDALRAAERTLSEARDRYDSAKPNGKKSITISAWVITGICRGATIPKALSMRARGLRSSTAPTQASLKPSTTTRQPQPATRPPERLWMP